MINMMSEGHLASDNNRESTIVRLIRQAPLAQLDCYLQVLHWTPQAARQVELL
jgi:hypothetical protein